MSKAKKKNLAPASDKLAKKQAKAQKRQQLAALCWRLREGEPEVLLITSRETGRWVVPKGWPMQDRKPWEAAATEAWEEAGVRGSIDDKPLGQFCYEKFLNRSRSKSRECTVDVYPLRVDQLAEDFPEQAQRQRAWFPLNEAAEKVAESGLQKLLADFVAQMQSARAMRNAQRQAIDPIGTAQAQA